jgi:hypothetical protein
MNVLSTNLRSMFAVMLALTMPQWVTAGEAAPIEWISTRVETAPVLDGQADAVWSKAVPLQVTVREAIGGTAPRLVTLRAVHTEDALYVLAQWPDATPSTLRDPFVWNKAQNAYARPTLPDDQFALEFPLEGQFTTSMLPDDGGYITDVWHWKAGRSNLGGWVDDKRHIISLTPVKDAMAYDFAGRKTIYISRPMDDGKPSYVAVPTPTAFAGDIVSSYVVQQPDGSQADVRGKGAHDGQKWTLEMGRKLRTGNADDAAIPADGEILCAIAVLDDELYWRHSVSDKLVLRLGKR